MDHWISQETVTSIMPTRRESLVRQPSIGFVENLRVSEEPLRRAAKSWDDIFVAVQDGGDKIVAEITVDDLAVRSHVQLRL
ncbi:MAG TPA: hypothetical protein VE135_16580 [Pyrinomonadaceae bacterium]|nr:hypothetical protein [Pyrinomonadaceae bacterium]